MAGRGLRADGRAMAEFEETSATPGLSVEPAIGTCTFFKKATKNKNLRKRVVEEDDDNTAFVSVQKPQKPKLSRGSDGPLEFSSHATMASQRLASTQGVESTKEIKAGSFFYESSREIQTQTDSKATATLETETEFDRDARALREKVLKQADEALKRKEPADEKLYKGLHGYTDHKAGFRREHTIAGEKAGGAHGPLRASSHIRWSVRFDYQPDICKDYKETGYCGYGDACKFMHDRGDYKSGWQMEREWEETEKKRKEKIAQGLLDEEENQEEDEDHDDLPFACFICRQHFKDPVMTACKHYFCERCALKHHATNKNCFVCNKPTNGVFNAAHEILKKVGEDKGSGVKKKSTR